MKKILLLTLLSLCTLFFSLWASADPLESVTNKPGPDLVNTLGVGARAIAMGGAFTAIANDASATFWNPARLGELPNANAMIEYRNTVKNSVLIGDTAPDLWDPNTINTPGIHVDPQRINFLGITKGLGDYYAERGLMSGGTFGVSYTLGGMLDYSSRLNETANNVTTIQQEDRKIYNNYLTLAYGKSTLVTGKDIFSAGKADGKTPVYKVDFGIGGFELIQTQTIRNATQTVGAGNDAPNIPPSISGSGLGYGVLVGATFELWGYKDENGLEPFTGGIWRIGATYRTKTKVNGLSEDLGTDNTLDLGQKFGRVVPSRATVGVAYEERQKIDPSKVEVTVQASVIFGTTDDTD